MLYKLLLPAGSIKIKLPWIPSSLRQEILFAYRDHPLGGHFGVKRTYCKIKDHFYWPKMYNYVEQYIQSCRQCARFNTKRRKRPGLLQTQSPPEGVFEVMQMDFWQAPIRSLSGNQYVLAVTDRLSKYVFAKALPSESAKDAAEMLYEDIILNHEAIKYLQSDCGTHFKNELVNALTTLIGCKQSFSVPYHPMSNGQVKRFNATFCDQLKKHNDGNLNDWDEYLQSIVLAYNSGIHATTGYTPYELAFTQKLISPFSPQSTTISLHKLHDYWQKAIRLKKLVLQAARSNIKHQQMLYRYDQGRAHPMYHVDDLVWIKVLPSRSKLDERYHGPFRVIQKLSEVHYLVEHMEEHYQRETHTNDMSPFYKR
ncbi:unnamed protein product [Didymodactylos carnosus]|uniref:Integrase catalytic domain-containing protein n=1 Tax=Didymodactylos carnosus TaxID=1234261 RepID=A0A815T8T5_9BILA|nr:unnamed protein product [Didymodactylos carnosus]CAF4362185.1 unnamed protein product [Didymodactylos carnosus]